MVPVRGGPRLKALKVHRGHVTRKLQASSLAELVRMADRLGLAVEAR